MSMTGQLHNSGTTEAIILIKAAPQIGEKHGETVCCAGLDLYGNWLRLYPVSFRHLEHSKKFSRWDRIKFNWRRPNDDMRPESRRVDQKSIEIVGKLKPSEKESFLANSVVTSLTRERELGRSLALLRPEIIEFVVEKKSDAELNDEVKHFENIRAQADLFARKIASYRPCPYHFKYRYRTDDGERFGTCQDWETEATFFKWSQDYGKENALDKIRDVFGVDWPKKGMTLAMGTHSRYPDTWLINGVIRLDEIDQPSFL